MPCDATSCRSSFVSRVRRGQHPYTAPRVRDEASTCPPKARKQERYLPGPPRGCAEGCTLVLQTSFEGALPSTSTMPISLSSAPSLVWTSERRQHPRWALCRTKHHGDALGLYPRGAVQFRRPAQRGYRLMVRPQASTLMIGVRFSVAALIRLGDAVRAQGRPHRSRQAKSPATSAGMVCCQRAMRKLRIGEATRGRPYRPCGEAHSPNMGLERRETRGRTDEVSGALPRLPQGKDDVATAEASNAWELRHVRNARLSMRPLPGLEVTSQQA
jgi:hypothetical protein